MSIRKEVQFIAHEHAERVILTDSFGKQHELKIDLLTTTDPDGVIAQEVQRMEEAEARISEIARRRGHAHPAIQENDSGGCKDCDEESG
ncbi:MAG: hypothetical protein DMG65_13705 [Candidatus Angelobacter sp. Gp1-AA117]|nr:MAG: hypothetical protein DMG65_13705 [Candidatus Angelobacter sp. Gp1-AA117]